MLSLISLEIGSNPLEHFSPKFSGQESTKNIKDNQRNCKVLLIQGTCSPIRWSNLWAGMTGVVLYDELDGELGAFLFVAAITEK